MEMLFQYVWSNVWRVEQDEKFRPVNRARYRNLHELKLHVNSITVMNTPIRRVYVLAYRIVNQCTSFWVSEDVFDDFTPDNHGNKADYQTELFIL